MLSTQTSFLRVPLSGSLDVSRSAQVQETHQALTHAKKLTEQYILLEDVKQTYASEAGGHHMGVVHQTAVSNTCCKCLGAPVHVCKRLWLH